MKHSALSVVACAGLLAIGAFAQSNAVAGRDVSLGLLSNVQVPTQFGGVSTYRSGTYPNGYQALSMDTTSCNLSSSDIIPWLAPTQTTSVMSDYHPYIGFMVARDMGGRFQQISDYSYVKHGFYALSNTQCGPCPVQSNGTQLNPLCSDTYAVSNNADNYYLGPATEIDPWLASWNPVGSHFDRGEPAVTGAAATDGARSLTGANYNIPGVGHRMLVKDSDLGLPGASYYYSGQYVIRGEPSANRDNNHVSRAFGATWNGSVWALTNSGTSLTGSILKRWSGAFVTAATNGTTDGTVYSGVKVTQNANGTFHYEYALHNRDSSRGVQALHIPCCASFNVTNVGFADIDATAANNWTMTRVGNELVFATATYAVDPNANWLRWNSIYNFWFDCDAGPASAQSLTLDAFNPGVGSAPNSYTINSQAPAPYVVHVGPGCTNFINPPKLIAVDTTPVNPPLPRAYLGNTNFGFKLTGAPYSASCLVALGFIQDALPLGNNCTLYFNGIENTDFFLLPWGSNALGVIDLPLPMPSDPAYEGVTFICQMAVPGGAILGYNLSNALRIRVGNSTATCP